MNRSCDFCDKHPLTQKITCYFKPYKAAGYLQRYQNGKRDLKSSSVYLPAYGRNYEYVDAAQPGDICALLVPSYTQAQSLNINLVDLKEKYGGQIAKPIHLTCQRFQADSEQLELLKPKLIHLAARTSALQLQGKQIEPFYSTFREQEILKCRIEATKEIDAFVKALNRELEDVGIEPHFPWVSELVTLLEDIQISRLQNATYDRHLFLGQRLMLTQIKAPGRYKPLFSSAMSQLAEAHR